MQEITIQTLDGSSFKAACSLPKGDHGPGLVVIHDLFSSLDSIQSINDGFAALGYVTVSPNLFHKQGFSFQEISAGEPDWDLTSKLYKNFDVESGLRDLLATLAHLRQIPPCGGKVGALGYCVGSRMAYLMAARSDIDCAVGYYGIGIESLLDEVYDIRPPLLLHFGENDKLMPASSRQRILRALVKNPVITMHTYGGADHGFMREGTPTYHAEHAALASARTTQFLAENLLV